ncbi:hypothetical protein [Micropruina sp.]|uniref:hypothetical protein n=1 Tax=Micropruina sp. TaxID=2737536 RepID=UPI00260F490C|nr:hypothetical protein [Micropruina sp.]
MVTSSPWRKALGRGRRALATLVGARGTVPPVTPPSAESDATARYRQRVATGEPPGRAALSVARGALAADSTAEALQLGYGLLQQPATAQAGRAVLGLCHLATSTPAQAWAEFEAVQDVELRGAACPEYAIAGFGADPDGCAARCTALVGEAPDSLTGYPALVLARHAFSVGHEPLARLTADVAETGGFGELTDYWASEFARLRSWFTDGFRRAPQPDLEADFRFGVLDYKQPDNASRNVGDYIQTLASLGHLVRRQGFEFDGDPELVAAMRSLRGTVKPERLIEGPPARIQLVEVQRDGSVYQDLPAPTWAVMFGWYLHPTFSGGYNLPFHPNLRPLFVSFHLNKPDALTPDAIDYLRRWAPIGCRDWQTVALLDAAGVPAFFSGCITTTVDTVFARTGPDERTGTAYIDAQEAPEEGEQIEQSVGDIRPLPLAENLALAREWVQRYHAEYAEVSTSRLHSYLPARSVGCRVDFRPKNPSDPRFGGLIGIDDAAYERIRHGILDKLAAMLPLLAQHTDEAEVYRRWRELCAPDVAAAQEFLGAFGFGRRPLPQVTLPSVGARVIVINAPRASKPLRRLLESVSRHAAGYDVIVVGAEADLGDGVHVVPAPQGQELAMAAVLDALPDATRALVLTSDTVLRDDPAELFDAPTSAAGLAAELDVRRARQSLSVLIRRVSARQGDDPGRALAFVASAHRRCGHGRQVPDVRACVIDAGALRAAGWSDLAGELIGTYSARFAEAVAVVTAGDFQPLPSHALTRVALERHDPDAVVLLGAGAARIRPSTLTGH